MNTISHHNQKSRLRIVFMGTPGFAVPSLLYLLDAGYHVVAIVTAPDKPAGRGLQLQSSEIKKVAVERNIPVLQPENLKDAEFEQTYQALQPDLNIVVAFRMLPEIIWRYPRFGTFNLHASLLPQYRGAAPINWAIIHGEKQTGLTTFFIDKEIDTGQIILQQNIAIGDAETAGELHDRMMIKGAEMVVKTVDLIENQQISLIDQSQIIEKQNIELIPAPKITKAHCRINWSMSLRQIYNLIRGLSPHPSAFTTLIDKMGNQNPIKIYRCRIEEFDNPLPPRLIETDNKYYLAIHHPEGRLIIEELQWPGRKRLKIEEFLRGFTLLTDDWRIE